MTIEWCFATFAATAVCIACMAHIVITDLTTRLISTRACQVLGIAGAMLQLLIAGLDGLVVGLFSMVAITVINIAINAIAHSRLQDRGIGGGDVRCMAAIALATGRGCIMGVLSCCVIAVMWALAMQVVGLRDRDEPFAFAPFMAIWLVVGIVAGLSIWV